MAVWLVHKGCAYPLEAVPPEVVSEYGEYRLRLEEERREPDLDGYQAEAGGVPLRLVRERAVSGQVTLEWEWTPEFFTGEFAFVIRYRGEPIYPPPGDVRRVLVRPDLRKLTGDDYEAMLADLMQWTSGWLTPAPGQAPAGSSVAPADLPLAQLALLDRHWEMVARHLEAVLERPRRRLVERWVDLPVDQVRTVTAGQWQAVLTRPTVWVESPAGRRLPERLPQAMAQSTLGVPENLFVRRLLDDLRQGLLRALPLLEGYGAGAQGAVARRQTERARFLLKRVSGWLRESWLSELEPPPGLVVPTPALLKHPVYGSLWRFYLRWRRAIALLDGGDRPVTLERTYQLYEYWCLLTVVRAVARHLGRDPDRALDGVMRRSGATVRLALAPGNRLDVPFRAEGVIVSFQRSFRYEAGEPFSLSHQQIPDITVAWSGGLLLFDPKYRVGHQGLLDGLGDMHRYRDAIVLADSRRAVAGGYLICPAEPVEAADRRYLEPAYQERWGFGICRLAPGGGEDAVMRVIERYLV